MIAFWRLGGFLATGVLAAAVVSESRAAESPLRPVGLRCEYRTEPAGIDVLQPRMSWILESTDAQARGLRQSAYQVLVASSVQGLDGDRGDLWDSGRVDSAATAHVAYAGRPLGSGQACVWKTRVWDAEGRVSSWSQPGRWSMGLLRPGDWKAKWIGASGSAFPWFRKIVSLPARPRKATAYVSAMGYFELFINGKKVGDDALAPAVSDYAKRALYRTYDVTGYLQPGKNCVAIWLGRGWYVSGIPGVTHDGPIAMAQVEIVPPKGPTIVLGTDATWKTHPSPIVPLGNPSRLGPQCYDATKEVRDWNTVTLDDSGWRPAAEVPSPPVVVSAQACEPNRVIDMIRPVGIEEVSPGTYLVDMGRLFTGAFEIRLAGPRGTRVHAEFVEHRAPDGKMTVYNQIEEYVSPGEEETFRTRFNYHAFRWVLLKGLPGKPKLEGIRGLAISTDAPRAAAFKCSNALLNRIYETTLWTYRCLSLGGYTVDCPHRERLGYGGDAHATMETAMTNFASGAFYTKWLADWRDAQDSKTGDLPHVAPPVTFAGGGPAWSGVCITLPWQMYRYYGDTRILEQMYPTIQRWLAFLETKTEGGLLRRYGHKEWAFLGDWVPPGRGQEPGQRVDERSTLFFNNCYYLCNLELAAKIAHVLGKNDDASKHIERAFTLAQAIHKEFFVAKDGVYANGEQPYLALALLTRVPPEDLHAGVLKNLEKAILTTDKGHINAGIHGHAFLIKALLAENRNDLIFTMVNQTTYPGWGHMLQQGATTIWEQWDGQNSHCHSSFLGVGFWFLQGPAGIRIDDKAPGFQRVVIRPAVVGDLRFVDAHCDTLRGRIGSAWKIDGDRLRVFATIPPNVSATVYVPAKDAATVTESDRPADQAPGVKFIGMKDGAAVYEVGSGQYAFVSAGFGKR